MDDLKCCCVKEACKNKKCRDTKYDISAFKACTNIFPTLALSKSGYGSE
jgi:hypothetical protein